MVASDDPRTRFTDLVKLSGFENKFIDKAQERRVLEEAVTRLNMPLAEARGLMRSVAEESGYSFESETGRRITQVLNRFAGRRGMVSRGQFNNAVLVLRDIADAAINDAEARRQVKRIMVENGWRPRRAGLFRTRRWFRQVEI